jgi:cytochrome b
VTATASSAKGVPPIAAADAQVKVWDLPLRLFHWLLVLAIALAFLSSEEDSPLNNWHVLSGWVAGILVVFRIAWGFVGGEHSRFSDFIRPSLIGAHVAALFRHRTEPELGHNPLGGISVLVLLALAGVAVWTGAFGGESAEDLHELVAWTLLAFIGLHIAAVVVMSLLERENLVRAMVSGTKPAARHPGARNAKRPGLIGLLIATLVVSATTWAVLRYDPHAFTLRSAESFEQRSESDAQQVPRQEEEQERD